MSALAFRARSACTELAKNGEFEAALDELNRLFARLGGRYPDVIVTLSPLQKEFEANLKYERPVREAELLIRQGRYDDAEEKLGTLETSAPPSLLARSGKLRDGIHILRTLAAANDRYYAGDGIGALQILRSATEPELAALRTKIQKVVDATEAAKKAAAKLDFDEAKRQWGIVLGLEPDEKNPYHRAATGLPINGSATLEDANREYEKGKDALEADHLAEAREHFEKAMEIYPRYEPSIKAIREFCRDKQKQWNFDRVNYLSGRLPLDAIIPKFEKVLLFLRPEDGAVYNLYKDSLDKLKSTGKFH